MIETNERETAAISATQARRIAIIKAWCRVNGVSMRELGRRVSGGRTCVQDIVSGKVASPTARTLVSLARHLGISVEDLEDPSRPVPGFCHALDNDENRLVWIPPATVGLNKERKLAFLPFPGKAIRMAQRDADALSDGGAEALRIWTVWGQHSEAVKTYDQAIVDISLREIARDDWLYVVARDGRVAVITGDEAWASDRVLGRVVRPA